MEISPTSDPAISALATFLRTLETGATWITPLPQKQVQATVSRIEGMEIKVRTLYAILPNDGEAGDSALRLTLVTVVRCAERRASYALDPV